MNDNAHGTIPFELTTHDTIREYAACAQQKLVNLSGMMNTVMVATDAETAGSVSELIHGMIQGLYDEALRRIPEIIRDHGYTAVIHATQNPANN